MIEFEDGRFGPVRTGVPSASLSHPNVAFAIQTQLRSLPPGPSSGIFAQPSIVRYGLGRELELAWAYAILQTSRSSQR